MFIASTLEEVWVEVGSKCNDIKINRCTDVGAKQMAESACGQGSIGNGSIFTIAGSQDTRQGYMVRVDQTDTDGRK